jgi:hypothetical protein
MDKDQDITRVIFKKEYNHYTESSYNKWEVFACLLDQPANPGNVVVYQHIGQHSESDISYCAGCRRATIDEYMPLFEELESIGYNLKVVRKFQYGRGK